MTQEARPLTFNFGVYVVPAYRDEYAEKCDCGTWYDVVTQASKLLTRSFELFGGYWRTSNIVLFDEASRLLEQAHSKLNVIEAVVNDEDAAKISHLQTYLINLAGVFG